MIEIANLPGMPDSENTPLMSDSTAGYFRMTNKLPRPLGEGWGEGWQNNSNPTSKTEGRGEGRHWQKTLQTATLSLALSFFIAAPVMAADTPPVPTLDRVKAENTTFINSAHSTYTLKEIITYNPYDPDYVEIPENAIIVNIGDKEYYYTPNEGDDTKTLQLVAATGNSALVETTQDKALYTVNGKYYTYNTDKLPNSGYKLTPYTRPDESDPLPENVITLYNKKDVVKYYDPTTGEEVSSDALQEGVDYKQVTTIETTPQYYTVELNKTQYGDPNGTTTLTYGWEKNAEGELEFKSNPTTPVGQTITYKYNPDSYTQKVEGQTINNQTVTNPSGTDSDNPYIFNSGVGLNNPEGSTTSRDNILYKDNKVTGELISTSTSYQQGYHYAQIAGGAVYNAGELTSISGAFVNNGVEATQQGNYARNYAYGGALYNSGTVGNIDADFVGNYASSTGYYARGGAIYNDEGTIGDITGDFIGNYASGRYAYGGAIYSNRGTIGNVTGDFIGNYASDEGGAIYNNGGTIGNITGDFIGNYAFYGGAIYNGYSATIGNITGDFIGNFVPATNGSAEGGAICNNETIGDITGDFIGNYAPGINSHGGAIYNNGTIGNITGDFIDNYAYRRGGAICNNETIGDITGDFIGNYSSNDYGGAIYNRGTIGDITGDFIGNYASGSSSSGGAICNNETIGDITGDFIGNYASGSSSSGGAIYNTGGNIANITGDFISNQSNDGGAIYSSSVGSWDADKSAAQIGYISGSFIKNTAENSGGAIYIDVDYSNGDSIIAGLSGNFINNKAGVSGGAINNRGGEISTIKGNFVGNTAGEKGGAIYNRMVLNGDGYGRLWAYTGILQSIESNFINNSAKEGGAIYNDDYIFTIKGDFINNSAESNGGAICNTSATYKFYQDFTGNTDLYQSNGYIDTIENSSFINNHAGEHGGAIWTNNDLTISANDGQSIFSGNYVESNNVKTAEAIYAADASVDLTLDTQNNGLIRFDDIINGIRGYDLYLTGDGSGTISLYNDVNNADVISDNVTIDFANNKLKDYTFNTVTANENTKLKVDIDISDPNNPLSDKVITENASNGVLTLQMLNFIGRYKGTPIVVQILDTQTDDLQLAIADGLIVVDAGDSVFNNQIISEIDAIALATTDTKNDSLIIKDRVYNTLNYINERESENARSFTFRTSDQYLVSEDLAPTTEGELNINGLGVNTPSTLNASGKTMFNLSNATTLNITNTSIVNAKDYAIKAENENAKVNLTNFSVKNTSTNTAAIQSNVDVNITADAGVSEFSGNETALQMNNANKTVNLNAVNKGVINLDDRFIGVQGYNINITGDNMSSVMVNKNIENANIALEKTNLYLAQENLLDNSQSLNLNSGNLYLTNKSVGMAHLPSMSLSKDTNVYVDVDLDNEKMDRLTADNYEVSNDAFLNVDGLNLLNSTDKKSVAILFADKEIANNVKYTGESPVVYSPIYKYSLRYEVNPEDELGYFLFGPDAGTSGDTPGGSTGGGSSNPSDSFNPAVLTQSVIQHAGAYATQLQTFNYVFQHADNYMMLPSMERVALANENKYAFVPDNGVFSPLMTKTYGNNFWVKSYASFENIPLHNGPKVSNINYGTLIGYDGEMQEISNGFERVLTGYIGYNGASQRYSGVDAYQNGGLIGGTATFYKGNFFNATTLSVGASAGDASTMYGSENYTMLLAGIGNKTGYNFEFFDGGLILQPNMLISYTFVNTFDYNNAAGVRIESDPLHAIQLAPGIKLIGNTKNGWQPYIGVNMVWNLLDDSRVTANGVRLPEMSIKPYVQYGVGVQKRFKDRFLAYCQAMIHNGGRNGVSLTGGLRWKVGK